MPTEPAADAGPTRTGADPAKVRAEEGVDVLAAVGPSPVLQDPPDPSDAPVAITGEPDAPAVLMVDDDGCACCSRPVAPRL